MDSTTNMDAWTLSRLGNAIDALVDRQLSTQSQTVIGQVGYGIDTNGNLYTLGTTTGTTAATAAKPVNLLLLLAIGAVVLMASHH